MICKNKNIKKKSQETDCSVWIIYVLIQTNLKQLKDNWEM